MKLTLLWMTMAAQLAASAAVAQTSDGPTGSPMMSGSFGADWSTSLGSAMFGDDNTTVRPVSEIETQWVTLSEEDRAMIRRDCMAFMQDSGGSVETGADGAEATDGAGSGIDAPGSTGADANMAGTEAPAMSDTGLAADTSVTGILDVSSENMQTICSATADL